MSDVRICQSCRFESCRCDGSIDLTLPWPPSNNVYWRHNRGRTHLSTEGRSYREVVEGLVAQLGLRKPLTGRLSVRLEAFPPDRRRRDVDNLPKSLLDALGHGGLYLDDSQIDRLLVERCDVVSGGCVRVRLFKVG